MYRAEVFAITKSKPGQYNPTPYTLHLCVDYHGIEEEARFRFAKLSDIPRYLLTIKNGQVQFHRGQEVYVSHPFEDANGLVFQYLHQSKEAQNEF